MNWAMLSRQASNKRKNNPGLETTNSQGEKTYTFSTNTVKTHLQLGSNFSDKT